jgi:hypothetical protein
LFRRHTRWVACHPWQTGIDDAIAAALRQCSDEVAIYKNKKSARYFDLSLIAANLTHPASGAAK